MNQYYIGVDPYGEPYIAHWGIKGQKWGIRRFQNPDGSLTEAGKKRYDRVPLETKRTARKDAKEFARAKMYYGEGAGNRRKLIKATVSARSKDPAYVKEFEKQLQKQDMAAHASKARKERATRDAINTTTKTARGVAGLMLGTAGRVSTTAAVIYAAAHYTGIDREVAKYAKDTYERVKRKFR